MLNDIRGKILKGGSITFEEAVALSRLKGHELFELLSCANNIREHFMGNKVDLCSILNVKSGKCSENCKYCAQSAHYFTGIDEYELMDEEAIIRKALEVQDTGAKRFSLVSSGRSLSDKDFDIVIKIYKSLRKVLKIDLCASHGIINYEQAVRLKDAGVSMYHHNLETSRSYFDNICTTHTYDERVGTIKAVQKAGMRVCCGGILSMGESMEQRIELAFAIRELGVDSVPINILNPIKGTPLENQSIDEPMELLKTIALFRLILPNVYLRFAGGRAQGLRDLQPLGYMAGINSSLVGNYLTTIGKNVEEDLQIIKDMGLEI